MSIRAMIAGTGSAIPEKILTNKDLEKMVDTTDEWITTRSGIKERHIAPEGVYTSTLAIEASKKALDMAGIKPEELDLIICATVTPDQPLPATMSFVQTGLGAKSATGYDIHAACSGFLFGLSMVEQIIRSGKHKKVLLVGAELLSRIVDWTDRATCILLADAAGAVVVVPTEEDRGILQAITHVDGSMIDLLHIPAPGIRIAYGDKRIEEERLNYVKMRGNELFKVATRYMEAVSREVLEQANIGIDDIALFIPHQANQRISLAVAERLKLPLEKMYTNIDRIGNTSAASIPVALDEVVRAGKIKRNDLVLIASFGAGVTWGGILIRW
jgi:3-oxoacyl-[acyl-carrier-protein] synthase III